MRVLLLSCLASCSRPAPTASVPPTASGPDLVVLLVVDQLPLRLLDAVRPALSGGLARLTGPDALDASAWYPYAVTYTGPGHATISTGALPAEHGVIANRWREDGRWARPDDAAALRVEAAGDVVGLAGGAVVGLSLKRRSAALLAGSRAALIADWDWDADVFDGPAWLTVDRAARLGAPWEARQQALYAKVASDDQPFEADLHGQGRTFPHPAPGGLEAGAVTGTPSAGALLVDAAIAATDHLSLGAGGAGDLLAVSFSHTDYIGHSYTAESWEAMDALVRLDEDLGRLFAHLDEVVGVGDYTVLLTSDHGAAPAPKARIDADAVQRAANEALRGAGIEGEVFLYDPWLWVETAPARHDEALELVRDVVAAVPGVVGAWAWRMEGVPNEAPYADEIRRSLNPERSGDIYALVEEGTIFEGDDTPGFGTRHGTPYAYDRLVPLLAVGAGIAPGHPDAPFDPRQVAPTITALLGLPPPGGATEAPIAGLKRP